MHCGWLTTEIENVFSWRLKCANVSQRRTFGHCCSRFFLLINQPHQCTGTVHCLSSLFISHLLSNRPVLLRPPRVRTVGDWSSLRIAGARMLTGWTPFLTPNQQCQNIDDTHIITNKILFIISSSGIISHYWLTPTYRLKCRLDLRALISARDDTDLQRHISDKIFFLAACSLLVNISTLMKTYLTVTSTKAKSVSWRIQSYSQNPAVTDWVVSADSVHVQGPV